MTRKPIFDAVRAMLGRGFTAREVTLLDRAIDYATGVEPELSVNQAGQDLVARFEGCRLQAYPDPGTGGEPWTVGYGATYYQNGEKVRPGDTITQEQADELLAAHLAEFAEGVDGMLRIDTTPNQFAAMVSLAFNVGLGAFGRSTLLKKHNAGDFRGAADQFLRWNRAGGRVMRGLTRRRQAERELYLS